MSPEVSSPTECPATTELLQLIDGTLSRDRQESYQQHLEGCSCCQQKLEELATSGTNLSAVVGGIRQSAPAANSAYWQVVKGLNAVAETIVPRKALARNPDGRLNFLSPSDDPAYLGRLSHFEVMRVIGKGGMGLVLEAFDSRLQRHVALKVLDPDNTQDELARQRFCREARSAASIAHENVVTVHQVERSAEGDLPYLVMQLVNGESLEQRLTRIGKLSVRETLQISLQAARGLAAAHAQGLIHRDIKPANILLEKPDGHVKLSDFGLARVMEDVKLTRTGFVSGTPLYMAPEQALGEDADPRSDLFSLGVVMYEMCVGKPPFTGNSALAILKQIADTQHRPIRELNPATPDWLADTIDKLLAKKPADRIQTAAQLVELLEFEWALLKTTSDDVPTVCAIEARRERIRNRWIAVCLGTTFLALGLLMGSFFAGPRGKEAVIVKSTAEPVAVLNGNSGAVWSASFSPSGNEIAMAVEDGSLRLWDISKQSVLSTLEAHRGAVWSARFSSATNRFVTAGGDGKIDVWELGNPEPLYTFKHPNAVRTVLFGADEQTLVAGDRDGELRVWSLQEVKPSSDGKSTVMTSAEPRAITQQPGAIYALAMPRDGLTIASAGSNHVVRLWNAQTLQLKLPLEGHQGPVYGLAFHPDGRRLVSAGWDKQLRIWDTGSGQLLKSWQAHDGDVWGVAISPEGQRLATAGNDGLVKLWDFESGELLGTYIGHNTVVHTVAFNLQGTQLASGGRDGAIRIWPLTKPGQ